jgi:uncharacterized membrane-anchored protein YhcB (DUF1043 family)
MARGGSLNPPPNPSQSTWWKSALGPLIVGILVFVLTYFLYYQPTLAQKQQELNQKQQELDQKQQEVVASDKRAKQAEQERDAIKAQWRDAKSKFLQPLDKDIRDANKTEKEWEGKTHPSPRQFAEDIVKQRALLRERVSQIKQGLDKVSDALDGDIDALEDALKRQPPATDAELRRLIGRLSPNQWTDKEQLIDDIIQRTVIALGYPAAANP